MTDFATVGEGGNALPYPMRWTNRTCNQFAPKSIAQTGLTLQRVKDWQLPIIHALPEHEGTFVLVGSSPYVTEHLDDIARLSGVGGNCVFAINSAHNLILDRGIPLNGTVLYEGGPDNHVRKFKLPQTGVTYYTASHCHPHQYEQLKNCNIVVWHALTDLDEQSELYLQFPYYVRENMALDMIDVSKCPPGMKWDGTVRDYGIIGGGATTFTRALNIGFYLGFRTFELFGFDSSFEENGESHYVMSEIGASLPTIPAQYPLPGGERSQTFWCKAFMARQAVEFMQMMTGTGLAESPHNPWPRIPNRIRFHGPGLLPSWHRAVFEGMYEDNTD